MDRRSLLKLMLATAAAESVDFEQLLWTPKSIITVPAMPIQRLMYFDVSPWLRIAPADLRRQIEQLESQLPSFIFRGHFRLPSFIFRGYFR